MIALLTLMLARASAIAEPPPPPPAEPSLLEVYAFSRAHLEEGRQALAARLAAGDEAALSEARTLLLAAMADDLIPAWYGTPWEFYGTSTTPGEGTIACGYFVSTTLLHAGFDVERVLLAQQPSEHIITTLVPPEHVTRWRDADPERVASDVAAQGDGLYLLGLDCHAGWLVVRGGQVDMCHSSFVGPREVLCQPAATSLAFLSQYRVTGALLNNNTLRRWLEGDSFPTDVWRGATR